ncbi:MAG: Rrf2 family transcriptional regulator [Victivallaceae bacterium]|nr:Rrf2 family transcriptional regulator [Victivallaceae bacterium]MDD5663983.1 Rrf2 family transcriptional regulator [Victivallaceae bacterium]
MPSILHISEAVALGIHACSIISEGKESKYSTPKLAEMLQASAAHLSKVMRRLVVAGIMESVPGPNGGFVLAKAPEEIYLLDIYQAIDGPFPDVCCMFKKPICNYSRCILKNFIIDENERARNYFSTTTLKHITNQQGEK